MITFLDFEETLVPLARRFGRTISSDQPPGQPNRSWSIGCGTDRSGKRDYWPCISIVIGWPTATLRTGPMETAWLHDLDVAVQIVATGKVP